MHEHCRYVITQYRVFIRILHAASIIFALAVFNLFICSCIYVRIYYTSHAAPMQAAYTNIYIYLF